MNMKEDSEEAIKFKLHLFGSINYVPDGKHWWALLPGALAPFSAKWGRKANFLSARSTHIPAFVVDSWRIDDTSARPEIEVRDWDTESACKRPFPLSAPPKAVFLPQNSRLEVTGTTGDLKVSDYVNEYVPSMSVISPRHEYVSAKCHPEGREAAKHLSGAFKLSGGDLKVAGYYDGANGNVDFGYVVPILGKLLFWSRVWGKKSANHLLWEVSVPKSSVITIVSSTLNGLGGSVTQRYILKPDKDGVVEAALFHGEVEMVTLFEKDSFLGERLVGLPDPDFEMYYPLSAGSQWIPGRVPVPIGEGGDVRKPCAPVRSKGFK